MSSMSDMDLMLHVDKEASSDIIADSAPARAKIKAMHQIGELLRTHSELEQDDVLPGGLDSDAMWSRIEASIDSKVAAESDLESRNTATKPIPPSWFEQVKQWFGGWQGSLATGAACALAMFLVMHSQKDASTSEKNVAEAPTSQATGSDGESLARPVALELKSMPPEVEHLEVFDGEGMVLTIPGDDGETAVIWVSQERDVEGPI